MEYQLKTTSGYQNWTKGITAIRHLRRGIASFVESEIVSQHTAYKKTVSRTCFAEYTCSNCQTETLIKFHETNARQFTGTPVCKGCTMFYKYIIRAHQNGRPYWNNCDFRKLSNNYWEYGKCFISGYGKEDVTSSEQTDVAGMISICLNNRKLCNKFKDINVLKKAIKTRNNIMHSGKLELTDDEINGYIDDFVSVLNEIPLEFQQTSQDAIKLLQELKNETMIVSTKGAVCAHRDAMKAVLGEIQVLLMKAKEIEELNYNNLNIGNTEPCDDDENNRPEIIQERLQELHEIEEHHKSVLDKHESQCAEIKSIIDDCFKEIRQFQGNFLKIEQTTTETQKEVRLMHSELKEVIDILVKVEQLCSGRHVPVPVTRLHMISTNIGKDKEEKFHRMLVAEKCSGDEGEHNVKQEYEKVKEDMSSGSGDNLREVIDTKIECLAIYVQCWSPRAVIELCEDCVSGHLTQLLKPIERELRKIPGYEFVNLEIVFYETDIKKCLDVLVRRLKRHCEEAVLLETCTTMDDNSELKQADNKKMNEIGKEPSDDLLQRHWHDGPLNENFVSSTTDQEAGDKINSKPNQQRFCDETNDSTNRTTLGKVESSRLEPDDKYQVDYQPSNTPKGNSAIQCSVLEVSDELRRRARPEPSVDKQDHVPLLLKLAMDRTTSFQNASDNHDGKHLNMIKDDYKALSDVTGAIKELGINNCGLIFGIDYTLSNMFMGEKSFHGLSLHDTTSQKKNPYQEVICILGETLEQFDDDGIILAYGFGDTTVRDTGIFPLKKEGECHGFMEVLEVYNKITPTIRLGGPTNFAPIVDEAIRIVKEKKQYHILVIVADGQVTNEEDTVRSIVKASEYPLSIVVIGVGDGPWDVMNDFDDKLPERRFDNLQFVDFHKIKTEARNPRAAVALAALMEIPDQFKYSRDNQLVEKL